MAPELLTLAQQKALDTVTQSACDRGLMAQAGERAKTVVGQLLGTSITTATAVEGATVEGAITPQPVVEIIVPDVDPASCAIAQSGAAPQSPASNSVPAQPKPGGAIAPDQVPAASASPSTAPAPAPAVTDPSAAPLPVPAVP